MTRGCLVAVLAGVLSCPALQGCARKPQAPGVSRAALEDDLVTTRVKTAFINDPVVGTARIDVNTFKGVVTLSGVVRTREEEAKAIALARGARGVTDVKSQLQVGP